MSDTVLAISMVNVVLNVTAVLLFLSHRSACEQTNKSLNHVARRLDTAAVTAFNAAEAMKTASEVAKMLALEDRLTMSRVEGAIGDLGNAADIVASDLADAHRRADATDGPHGAASDAAMRTDAPTS